jgi:hypothetical protein
MRALRKLEKIRRKEPETDDDGENEHAPKAAPRQTVRPTFRQLLPLQGSVGFFPPAP